MGRDQDDVMIIPLRTFQRRIAGNRDIAMIQLSVRDETEMDRVKLAVERLMRERRHLARNEENNFSVLDTRQIAQTLTGTTRSLRLQILPRRAQWQQPLRAGLNATGPDAQTLATWWTTLNDADLSDLIERAAAGNLDLKIAQARVREARGRRGIARAGLFPFFDLGGSATVSRGSEDIGSGERRELYRTGFDASWEVDVSAACDGRSRPLKEISRRTSPIIAT